MTIQIVKSLTEEFTPHMAVTHMDLNGGAANGENISLVMKANKDGEAISAILKSLDADDDVLVKASYNNKRKMINQAIRDSFEADSKDEYVYIYLEDFDENTAVFEQGNKVYSIGYSMTPQGIVLLVGDFEEVVRQDIYVSVDGSTLVLKSVDNEDASVVAGVDNTEGKTSNTTEEKNDMSDKTELNMDEMKDLIEKASIDAVTKARASWKAEAEAELLVKSTEDALAGFSFVAKEDAPALVKSLVDFSEGMPAILKALGAAQDVIAKGVEDLATSEAAKEELKKEFGVTQSVDGDAQDEVQDSAALRKAAVKAAIANRKNK